MTWVPVSSTGMTEFFFKNSVLLAFFEEKGLRDGGTLLFFPDYFISTSASPTTR